MSITTKTGDGGETSLWTGERVRKDDLRVETYGTLDELSSFLGLARHSCRLDSTLAALERVQRDLYRACTELASATPPEKGLIGPADEERITADIRALEAAVPLSGFVLPGMTPGSAALDVARTVCRRAERLMVALSREASLGENVRRYVNRLSDYLFMLARSEEAAQGMIRYQKG
jgi:ATP:cob(I)alamin adenosyltransferase